MYFYLLKKKKYCCALLLTIDANTHQGTCKISFKRLPEKNRKVLKIKFNNEIKQFFNPNMSMKYI